MRRTASVQEERLWAGAWLGRGRLALYLVCGVIWWGALALMQTWGATWRVAVWALGLVASFEIFVVRPRRESLVVFGMAAVGTGMVLFGAHASTSVSPVALWMLFCFGLWLRSLRGGTPWVEPELDVLQDTLQARRDELSAMEAEQSRLAEGIGRMDTLVGDELRPVLQQMASLAWRLKKEEVGPEAKALLCALGRATVSMTEGLQEGWVSGEAVSLPPLEPVRLSVLVQDVVRLMERQATGKGLELNATLGEDVPELCLMRSVLLRTVVMNLVSNAVKFTSSGGVMVGLDADPLEGSRMRVRLWVKDSGVGIPRDRLDAVFEPFEQAEEDTRAWFGGTGLGLPMVARCVEALGGELTVDSVVGQGTRFDVRLVVEACGGEPPRPMPGSVMRVRSAGVVERGLFGEAVFATAMQELGVPTCSLEAFGTEAFVQQAQRTQLVVVELPEVETVDPAAIVRWLRSDEVAREVVFLGATCPAWLVPELGDGVRFVAMPLAPELVGPVLLERMAS